MTVETNQPANANANADANQNGNGGGTVPITKPENANETVTFDPAKVSDADFAKVFEDPRTFQHPRFKELNDKAKKAAEYEAEKQKEKEAKLAEEGKFKELLAEKDKKIEDLTTSQQTSLTNIHILQAAQKAGSVKPEAVLKLIDRANIKLNDDGTITGVDEAIKALSESDSYLFKDGKAIVTIGSPTNPGPDVISGVRRFKLSEIQQMSPSDYLKNEKDINNSMRSGMVEDDVNQPSSRK